MSDPNLTVRRTVAQVVSGLDSGGGVEKIAYDIAAGLDPARYRVIVCCLQTRGVLADRLQCLGLRIHCFHGESSSHPRYLLKNLRVVRALALVLRKENVELVHAHEFYSGTAGRVAARLAGVPRVALGLHKTDSWKRAPHIAVDRFLLRWTDAVICNSRAVRDFAIRNEELDPGKFQVIYNGIDPRPFVESTGCREQVRFALGIPLDAPVLALVARLSPEKGHRFLVDALPALRSRFPNLHVLLIGDDNALNISTKGELIAQIQTLQLERMVHLLGQREDVPQLLPACDVFVAPSLQEGFGLVIAEAMAAARPVVASRVDGIPEVVEEGVTGLLVPPADPTALANAILCLLEQPEQARAMGEAGRKRALEHFTAGAMVSGYDALYADLLSRHGHRASAAGFQTTMGTTS